MKRLFITLGLIGPAGLLLLLWLFPEFDRSWEKPLLHFYLVAFFAFTAIVVSLFTAVSLGKESTARHALLATAFAVMGVLFLVHAVTTPNAIIFTFNPGIGWAAWLTLFIGGLIFALAALDKPERPLQLSQLHLIHWALALFCVGFILIVAFVPHWLTAIDEKVGPWHQQTVFWGTLLFWGWAAARLWRTWQNTQHPVDGTMAQIAAWGFIGTVSMHLFPVWQVSWWLYHGLLLLGVGTAVIVLILSYERLRHFQLTTYYAATGLIVTAALALLASHLFSQTVERTLAQESLDMVEAVIAARLNGLLIAGLVMGLFYGSMFFVIRRGDRLISRRSAELAQAYADLQAAELLRDDLTNMIVHDLRSPLTSLKLGLNLVKTNMDNPERQQKVTSVLTRTEVSIRRMMTLIDQLLDVARLESGQLKTIVEPESLAVILQEKAAQFINRAENDGKEITVHVAPDLPTVLMDRGLIDRVLDNLVSNAFNYTHSGGHIALHATWSRQTVVVQIVDNGEGIPLEAAAHIFDKFYQVKDDGGESLRRGTGLGLTFCKLAVEAHNGHIWLESKMGQGSTFAFSLPLNLAA